MKVQQVVTNGKSFSDIVALVDVTSHASSAVVEDFTAYQVVPFGREFT